MKYPNYGFVNFGDIKICKRYGKDLNRYLGTAETSIPHPNAKHQPEDSDSIQYAQHDLSHTMESIRELLEEIDGPLLEDLSEKEIASPSTIQSQEITHRKGGFGIRIFTFVIDIIIIHFSSLLLLGVGALAVGVNYSPDMGMSFFERLIEIVPFYFFALNIVAMAYYIYFIGASGQNIGKLICHLKVVQTSGQPLSYGQAFLRWVGYLVSTNFFCLSFLGIAIESNRQSWHDKIADTYVLRA